MPRRDGTGPDNEGPKTGRGLGNCPTDKKPVSPTRPRPLGPRPGNGGGRSGGRRGQNR